MNSNILNLISIFLGQIIRKPKFDGVFPEPPKVINKIEVQVFKYKTARSNDKTIEIHHAIRNFVSKEHPLRIILDSELKERSLSEIFNIPEPLIDKYKEYFLEYKKALPYDVCTYRDCYLVVHKEHSDDIISEFMSIPYTLTEVSNDTFNKYMEEQERKRTEFLKSIKY